MSFIPEYPANAVKHGCCRCGASRRPEERLIDLNLITNEIEDLEGNVYGFEVAIICETCIREFAGNIGCAMPEIAARHADDIATRDEMIQLLDLELDALKTFKEAAKKVSA